MSGNAKDSIEAIRKLLAKGKPKGVRKLWPYLLDKDESVRKTAIEAINQLAPDGSEHPNLIESLVSSLESDKTFQALRALDALDSKWGFHRDAWRLADKLIRSGQLIRRDLETALGAIHHARAFDEFYPECNWTRSSVVEGSLVILEKQDGALPDEQVRPRLNPDAKTPLETSRHIAARVFESLEAFSGSQRDFFFLKICARTSFRWGAPAFRQLLQNRTAGSPSDVDELAAKSLRRCGVELALPSEQAALALAESRFADAIRDFGGLGLKMALEYLSDKPIKWSAMNEAWCETEAWKCPELGRIFDTPRDSGVREAAAYLLALGQLNSATVEPRDWRKPLHEAITRHETETVYDEIFHTGKYDWGRLEQVPRSEPIVTTRQRDMIELVGKIDSEELIRGLLRAVIDDGLSSAEPKLPALRKHFSARTVVGVIPTLLSGRTDSDRAPAMLSKLLKDWDAESLAAAGVEKLERAWSQLRNARHDEAEKKLREAFLLAGGQIEMENPAPENEQPGQPEEPKIAPRVPTIEECVRNVPPQFAGEEFFEEWFQRLLRSVEHHHGKDEAAKMSFVFEPVKSSLRTKISKYVLKLREKSS